MDHRTPVLDALNKMAGTLPMHMPGHKRNPCWGSAVSRLSRQGMFNIDFTEVPGLDDLHAPEEAIAEAQKLAAECFGAKHTYFLVNGASVGIMAAILACCGEGEKVLVPRNAHRCVYEGLVLSGAVPVYFQPGYHPGLRVPLSPIKEQVLELIDREQPVALIMVNPTYHGAACDLSLIECAREKGLITIVDEAHGSHFIFDERLPKSALTRGADVVVHSTHKTLGSLTQTGLLHLGTNRINPQAMSEALSLLQTTSPSYVLMASLDTMRADLAEEGPRVVGRAVDLATRLRAAIPKIPGFSLADVDNGVDKSLGYDCTKIMLQSSLMNGFELGEALRSDFCIYPELEEEAFVLLMLTVGDTAHSIGTLIQALENISRRFEDCPRCEEPQGEKVKTKYGLLTGSGSESASTSTSILTSASTSASAFTSAEPGRVSEAASVSAAASDSDSANSALMAPLDILPPMVLTPRQAFKSQKVKVNLKDSVGCISGSLIVPYPPGVPVVCPGEGISAEIVEYLNLIIERGAHVQGLFLDGREPQIWILEC